MEADFELKPTTTYNPTLIRELLGHSPGPSTGDKRTDEAPSAADAGASSDDNDAEPMRDSTPRIRPSGIEEHAAFADELDAHGRDEAARGAFTMARALHEKAVELRRHLFGETDPKLVQSLTWLGALSLMQGQIDEASCLFSQAHAIAVKMYGREHLRVAVTLNNLGLIARRQGDLVVAAERYEQALAVKRQTVGWLHPSVAATLMSLGNLARIRGELHMAMTYYTQARDIYEKTEGGVSSGLAATLVSMARVYIRERATDAAIMALERAVRIREAIDVLPVHLAGARALLARLLRPQWPVEARRLMRSALRDYEASPDASAEYAEALRDALLDMELAS